MHHDAFVDYILSPKNLLGNQPKNFLAYNQNTTAYCAKRETLYIFEIRDDGGPISANLLCINLSFSITGDLTEAELKTKFEELKKSHFARIPIDFLDFTNRSVKIDASNNAKLLPNNMILNAIGSKLAFYNKHVVFAALLDIEFPLKAGDNIKLEAVQLGVSDVILNQVKWHYCLPDHICLLSNKNEFMVFDLAKDMDDKELLINLTPKHGALSKKSDHRGKIQFEDDEEYIVDFCFSPSDELRDLRNLSVFFLACDGSVFCYCPILLEGMKINKADIMTLKKELYAKFEADPRSYESARRYYEFLFDYFDNFCEPGKPGTIFTKSVNLTKYESLVENSIQGPFTVVDGGEARKKVKKSRKNYTGIYAAKGLQGHLFVVVKSTGRCSVLYTLDSIFPNTSKHKPTWDSGVKIQLLTVARLRLEVPSERINPPAQAEQNKDYQEYLQYFGSTSPVVIYPRVAPVGTFYIKFYNKIYSVEIEWVRAFEANLGKTSLSTQIYKRNSMQANVMLIAENVAPAVTQEMMTGGKFDIADYEFYGVQELSESILAIVKSKAGDINCRFFKESYQPEIANLKTTLNTKITELKTELTQDQLDFAKDLNTDLADLSQLRASIPPKCDPNDLDSLTKLETYLNRVGEVKDTVENNFAERISLLLRMKAGQADKLKDLEARVKILLQKKENFEECIQHDLHEHDEKVREKFAHVYDMLNGFIAPLSKSDRECAENLSHLSARTIESKRDIEKLKQSFETYNKLLMKMKSESPVALNAEDQQQQLIEKLRSLKLRLDKMGDDLAVIQSVKK